MNCRTYYTSKLGNRFLQESPEIANAWLQEIKQHENTQLYLKDLDEMFLSFCEKEQLNPVEVKESKVRSSDKIINARRLFIAVALKLFDQLSINGYTKRKARKLRLKLSQILNCNEIWISQVTPSILFEIKRLKGYGEKVDEIIIYLQPNFSKE